MTRCRLPYSHALTSAAAAIARKTFERRGVRLVNKRGVQAIARTLNGEALPLMANQLWRWS